MERCILPGAVRTPGTLKNATCSGLPGEEGQDLLLFFHLRCGHPHGFRHMLPLPEGPEKTWRLTALHLGDSESACPQTSTHCNRA